MSLLAEILSKINIPSYKKDVPPQLRKIVKRSRVETAKRKKKVIFSISFAILILSGSGTVYFAGDFQKKAIGIGRSELQVNQSSTNQQLELPRQKSEIGNQGPEIEDTKKEIKSPQKPENPLKAGKWNVKEETALSENASGDKMTEHASQSFREKDTLSKVEDMTRFEKSLTIIEKEPTHKAGNQPLGNNKKSTLQGAQSASKNWQRNHSMEQKIRNEENKRLLTEGDKKYKIDRHLYMANDFERQGLLKDAFDEYKKASDLDKGNYRILNRMAFILIKEKRYHDAIHYAKKVIEIREDYLPAMINLAIAYSSIEMNHKAEESFKKALRIAPKDRNLLYNFALFYEKNKRYDDALKINDRLWDVKDKKRIEGIERITGNQ